MLKAVIFDFDGVIADSEPLHCQAFQQVLKAKLNIDIPKEQYYSKYLGYTDVDLVENLIRDLELSISSDEIEELLAEKTVVFEELVRTKSSIIDGVTEFIEMLKSEQVPMAICSGALASDIELMLDGSSLADSFKVIVTADDTSKGKPDPEGFLLAVERLNEVCDEAMLPGECVVIEDSHWGLDAAKSAGMIRVAVANTYTADELAESAEKVVTNLRELNMLELRQLCCG
ncbi:MAG TPA: HAD family phosphatase [Phycisphaerales bacterium]|nr:HAD family phosphatase [Phycisphaerales bacterium]